MLPPKVERIYQARRAAQLNRLISASWSSDQADAGVVAWEAHADTEGRHRGRAAYWDGAEPWIIDWLRRRRDGRP